MGSFRPRVSSNRMSLCKAFLRAEEHRLPGAVSSSRSAWSRRMVGLRGGTFECVERTHQSVGVMVQQPRRNGSRHVPGRDASGRVERLTRIGLDQAMGTASRWNGWPDFSIACMITASLRATATAARLKPTRSRSLTPQVRKALSALVRVRTTVAGTVRGMGLE
jgi:hypothetical protein